ncbi:MAG: efflux RND transporter periplasmic adaptor subunit [Acidobacteriota bacterium]
MPDTPARVRLHTPLAAAALASLTAACGAAPAAGPGGPGGPGGAMPAMAVEIVTLAERPVERRTEFVGTVRSRRSTTIQPQVEGFITRIAVRSGDRVRPGTVLVEIDAERQAALVASLESQKAVREAELAWARQQAERATTLLAAGAISQQEVDQAAAGLKAAEAQLRAVEEQIRQQQVELAYHRVTSPVAGTVGDIPVRVGDRVTRSTVITTVDENAGFEVYVSVPVQQAPALARGLPVRLLDEAGAVVSTNPIAFVAPTVDPETQSVLVKTALVENADRFRSDQFVRAEIVWDSSPGLTIPVVAVTRINAQYFVYVAEPGEGGMLVARQRPVQLGPIVGNDYTVVRGLSAGDRLIVSGIQKIGDGAPVQPAGAAPPR